MQVFLFAFFTAFLAAGIYSLLSRVFPSAVNTAVLSGSPVAISGGLSATVAGARFFAAPVFRLPAAFWDVIAKLDRL